MLGMILVRKIIVRSEVCEKSCRSLGLTTLIYTISSMLHDTRIVEMWFFILVKHRNRYLARAFAFGAWFVVTSSTIIVEHALFHPYLAICLLSLFFYRALEGMLLSFIFYASSGWPWPCINVEILSTGGTLLIRELLALKQSMKAWNGSFGLLLIR